MQSPIIYQLKRTDPPWGDYGDMLIHGMASRSVDGTLELERSGPFVPPISQPWLTVVVTAAFLCELQESGLTGFESGPVKKKRIPKIDWRTWEPYGTEVLKYPAGGEPENYIVRRKHSPEAADALGELWEVRIQAGIQFSRDGGYHLIGRSWTGADLFVTEGEFSDRKYVSERARQWLLAKVPEWVAFDSVRVD